jgi:hypothetical protein
MTIIAQANAAQDLYVSVMEKMTGSEKEHMDMRFKELDSLIESKYDEKLQLEVLTEINQHLGAI